MTESETDNYHEGSSTRVSVRVHGLKVCKSSTFGGRENRGRQGGLEVATRALGGGPERLGASAYRVLELFLVWQANGLWREA